MPFRSPARRLRLLNDNESSAQVRLVGKGKKWGQKAGKKIMVHEVKQKRDYKNHGNDM